jgi:hypothetical protein
LAPADSSGSSRRGAFDGPGAETAGLILLALLITASLVFDFFTPAVIALAGVGLLVLAAGSAFRVFAFSLGLMMVFTVGELSAAQFGFGFFILRIDEYLLLAFLAYYLLAVADGRAAGHVGRGFLPGLILLFLALSGISMLRGFASGSKPDEVWSLRTFLGYAVFFPACWITADPDMREKLWKVLLVSGTLAGAAVLFKAVTGIGEGVIMTETTGVRVGSRIPNIAAAMMVVLVARIWKAPAKPPMILAIPSLILMAISVLISQTRGLWAGTLLSLAAAWFLSLFRKEHGKPLTKRLVVSLSLIAGLVVAGIVAASVLGVLSTSDLSRRVQGEETSYPIDVSLLSRLLSWAAILKEVQGPALLYGNGIGSTITYFKPEFSEVRTMSFIDGSYWQTLLDMGLVGVISLAAIYVASIASAARLFLRTGNESRASVALGIFCALIVIMTASQLSSVLTNYSYTVVWALMLAMLHLEWRAERAVLAVQTQAPPCSGA